MTHSNEIDNVLKKLELFLDKHGEVLSRSDAAGFLDRALESLEDDRDYQEEEELEDAYDSGIIPLPPSDRVVFGLTGGQVGIKL